MDQIQQVSNQSENNDIPEKAEKETFTPILILYVLFLFLIDLIHSVLLDQKFHQWQCSKGDT